MDNIVIKLLKYKLLQYKQTISPLIKTILYFQGTQMEKAWNLYYTNKVWNCIH